MDILSRIQELNEERGWSMYKLAREAQISNSTLTNMVQRQSSLSIVTLEKLCRAYRISLAEFFGRKKGEPGEEKERFEDLWDFMDPVQRDILIYIMESFYEKTADD